MDTQVPPKAKPRTRRCTKTDQTPRPYTCGCGRGYYSYPALYTHLKLKHEGNPPEGTKLPVDKHYGSRGRPREKVDTENHQVLVIQYCYEVLEVSNFIIYNPIGINLQIQNTMNTFTLKFENEILEDKYTTYVNQNQENIRVICEKFDYDNLEPSDNSVYRQLS